MEFDRFCHLGAKDPSVRTKGPSVGTKEPSAGTREPSAGTREPSAGIEELSSNVLPFWLKYIHSAENSFLVGELDAHGIPNESADLSSILLFRILWSFSASYRALGNPQYFDAAIKVYSLLNGYFKDRATGFFHDRIDARRIVVEASFSTITQAYAIYSLSEFYAIFLDRQQSEHGESAVNVKDIEEQLVTLITRLVHSTKTYSHGVYNNHIERKSVNDGASLESVAKEVPLNGMIDVRCQLHLVEAFSNFHCVTGNAYVGELLTELLLVFELHVFSKESAKMTLEFDANWQPTRREISYGHNLECAWILFDSAKRIKNKELKKCLSLRTIELVDNTLNASKTISGAVSAGIKENGDKDERLVWWVQTEAINALLTCFELTKNESYLSKSLALWSFVQEKFRDSVLGEWFTELTPLAAPNFQAEKVGPWRGPYHITRVCLKLSGCEYLLGADSEASASNSKKNLQSQKSKNIQTESKQRRTIPVITAG